MRTAGRFRPFFRVRFQRRSNGAELNICLPPWVVKRLRETVHEWVLKSMVFERIFIVLIQAKKQSLTKCVRPVNILNYWEFKIFTGRTHLVRLCFFAWMRTMKIRSNTMLFKTHTRTVSLNRFTTQGGKQMFNSAPFERRWNRTRKNGLKRPAVRIVHE